MRDKLRALIDQLRLHGMAEVLDAELARAEREAIPAAEVLARLLGQEAASRRERSLAYRLTQARLPWRWSLDSFPFDRQPGVSKTQIQTLAGLDFLRRADNVLLIGKPGTGKTGLALGLLREAGVSNYSIYLDDETNILFGYLERTEDHRMAELPNAAVMRRWWDFMQDIMRTEGGAPVALPLDELFHMD